MLVLDFNERYDKDVHPPNFVLIDKENSDYSFGTIRISRDYLNWTKYIANIMLKHEVCHHFQARECRFGMGGESFCEVFAGRAYPDNYCEKYNVSSVYCAPFKLDEVNRQGFVDCVFMEACSGLDHIATDYELMKCYNEHKKDS
jgi:hypothetical protein